MGATIFLTEETDGIRRRQVAGVLYTFQVLYGDGVEALRTGNEDFFRRCHNHINEVRESILEERCRTSENERDYLSQAGEFYERKLNAVVARAQKTGRVREYFWDGGWPRPKRVRSFTDTSAPRLSL